MSDLLNTQTAIPIAAKFASMDRRSFLAGLTVVTITAGAVGVLATVSSTSSRGRAGRVRLRAIPGKRYPEYFLRFIREKTFETPRAALLAVKDPELEYLIEYQTMVAA